MEYRYMVVDYKLPALMHGMKVTVTTRQICEVTIVETFYGSAIVEFSTGLQIEVPLRLLYSDHYSAELSIERTVPE